MATTFAAPSGATLPNPYAPRVFTTSGDVACVSARLFDVEHPDRIADETVVYARGEFQGRFKAQSKREGNVFTVVRDGGWSRDLALYVEPLATSTPTGYDVLADVDFAALPSTNVHSGQSNKLAPFTESLGGLSFLALNNTYEPGFGEGSPPFTQNVNGAGYRLVGIGTTYMRSGGTPAYLVTDIRNIDGYAAGRKYGCLAVIDYNISRFHPQSMAYVGCFDPSTSPGSYGWTTQSNDSGFGCGAIPRPSTSGYKPVLSAPVVGESSIEDVPAENLTQLRSFTPSTAYILGTLRRSPGVAEGVAGPYSPGPAPSIESLMSIGSVQTLWAGSMNNLRWGVCWKGRAEFPYRHQQYCFVKRMIFYQSKA